MEDDIDLQLRQLALEAQQHPAQSVDRQKALTRLRNAIWLSGTIGHPQRRSWPDDFYEDIHNEALLKTLDYICRNIDKYNPEKPVMAWVNQILNYRVQDVVDRYMNENRRRKLPSLNDIDALENYPSPESSLSEEAKMLRELIEEDPDGNFRNVSVRGRPDITWQNIALAKLDDETSDSIAQKFGVPRTTIDSFFNRNLRNFGDDIRNQLQ